jgi:hypothetical protein
VPLTFSTGLTGTSNTITVNSTQNITKSNNLTTNGLLKTINGDGTLSDDTAGYLPTTGGAISGNITFANISTSIGSVSNHWM